MAWVRIDDTFYDHPKVLAAGPKAVGLWVRVLAYCSHHLTDGEISLAAFRSLGGTKRDATALVGAGLLEVNGKGWVIHDYAEYQMTRQEIETRRSEISRKRSEAGRRGAQKRWHGNSNPKGNLP